MRPPFDSVQLVNITQKTMFMVRKKRTSYWGESKPTYNWGSHIVYIYIHHLDSGCVVNINIHPTKTLLKGPTLGCPGPCQDARHEGAMKAFYPVKL